MQITLTKQQHTNLLAFMQRVDLKGSEVSTYVDVLNAIVNTTESEV